MACSYSLPATRSLLPSCSPIAMELSPDVIRQVVLPTAALYPPPEPPSAAAPEPPADDGDGWQTSWLNPKNRIDSLDLPRNPSWRIDGCIAYGTQLFAVPLFLGPTAPQRVDVFLPSDAGAATPALRLALDLGTAFHTRDARATRQLGLARHVVRLLQHWTAGASSPARRYRQFPFGSRIVLHNLPVHVADAHISVAPAHHLERQLLSVAQLRAMWQHDDDDEQPALLPETVDLGALRYESQPHDSVSIVRLGAHTLVFKAITSHTKYLYHELRQLLRTPPHPNVIARPRHLVTKRCGFGAKTAVVGFTLTHHRHGTVRDHIPHLALHGRLAHRDEVRWARQLVRALRHVRAAASGGGGAFYSDLRLDNVLLSDDGRDLILVDFEQRGVWSEFAAPEINAVECVRELAMAEEEDGVAGVVPEEVRARCAGLLARMLPHWEALVDGEAYGWPAGRHGYNVAWQCLAPAEQESCEVYMLGRVLWCLFEAQSAPQRAAVWTSYRCEPAVEFPAYARTPPALRRLVDWCTAGRVPTLSSVVVRSGSTLVLRELETTGGSTPENVRAAAAAFWRRRIAESERWVRNHIECREAGRANEAFPDRPSLAAVEAFLDAYDDKL